MHGLGELLAGRYLLGKRLGAGGFAEVLEALDRATGQRVAVKLLKQPTREAAARFAREARVGLCLKHYPGIGGADVDSHRDFMDISDKLRPEQEALFHSLAPNMFGDAVLVSHALVRQWDRTNPATLSSAAVGRLRARLPQTLLITDDMQMQGLQKALGTAVTTRRSETSECSVPLPPKTTGCSSFL